MNYVWALALFAMRDYVPNQKSSDSLHLEKLFSHVREEVERDFRAFFPQSAGTFHIPDLPRHKIDHLNNVPPACDRGTVEYTVNNEYSKIGDILRSPNEDPNVCIPYAFNQVGNDDLCGSSVLAGGRQFLVTKGPTFTSLPMFINFWKEQKPCLIVSLVTISDRIINFWEPNQMNEISGLHAATIKDDGDISVNQLKIENIVIPHIAVPCWRDGEVIDMENFNKLIELIAFYEVKDRPIHVHCKAGCGRTGTLLAAYDLHHNPESSIMKTVVKLRLQRPHMVGNVHQYLMLQSGV